MDQKTFTLVAGAIFAAVALLHILRILMGWSAVIDDWTVPMWVSWIGFVVAGGLSYFALNLAMRR
jgi:drug/metabolite transporter (DMT)-like permease